MDLYFTFGSVVLTFLIYKVLQQWMLGKQKMPDIPGPKGWPLVGNSLQMDPMKPHETLMDWSKIYGNIFKIKIFQDTAVVLNDFESINEMLMSEACSARPNYFRINEILFKSWKDIEFEDFTAEWNERKKVLSRSLNAYGSGQMKIESITAENIDEMFAEIIEKTEHYRKSIDMRPIVHKCTSGIFTTLLYGQKLEESEIRKLLEVERGVMKLMSPAGLICILDIFSWMRYFPMETIQGPINAAKNIRKWISQKHHEMMGHSLSDTNEGVYYSLMKYVNKATNKVMPPGEIMGMAVNSVTGGFATSTATLYSLILVLINNPELQENIHKEIDQVTEGRRPQMSDRQSMPYVRAVLEENNRFSTITPLSVPHLTSRDTMVNGKFIPKGTILLPNIWNLHHDKRYFEDPWKFKPERYLTSDGEILPADHPIWKHTMAFGAGRRICPGEGLARHRIFLILTCLMQKYKFLPEDDNIPSSDPRNFDGGIIALPYPYKVKISER